METINTNELEKDARDILENVLKRRNHDREVVEKLTAALRRIIFKYS